MLTAFFSGSLPGCVDDAPHIGPPFWIAVVCLQGMGIRVCHLQVLAMMFATVCTNCVKQHGVQTTTDVRICRTSTCRCTSCDSVGTPNTGRRRAPSEGGQNGTAKLTHGRHETGGGGAVEDGTHKYNLGSEGEHHGLLTCAHKDRWATSARCGRCPIASR